MDFNAGNAKKLLAQFEFAKLFIEELGWDQHNAHLSVTISVTAFTLKAVAEKRGAVAWVCRTTDGQIPERPIRQKIDREVSKSTFEHLIIFVDESRASQVWSWPRREFGKPVSLVDHIWRAASQNTPFIQKLHGISFRLSEENELTLPKVTARLEGSLNAERVTKRFYDQFKAEHKAFLDFVSGITDLADREWYASLMLNRLMFIYFMQRKGFLNGERDYLRDRLARCQREKGHDKFYSFYRYFLLRLFHEGLGGKTRNPELDKLLGRIPYLNGGLFEQHPIEERCPDIKIPDEAFTRIFAYFDRYQWHLDERPLRNDTEINPDVLGYIFEKYINQKQMGAYYTKEDITEYISKNTVIPFLFDAAKAKCKVAFENQGGPTIWNHLRDDPDRYIYTAVKYGVESPLPPAIAAGITDVSARTQWNRTAPSEFGLPTEIWREVVARRTRYAEVRAKLASGEVHEINDLITLNLDIRQFAQDVIERCEEPDLLRAFWKAIESVTVLDPTCGSGAFLFAALNILEPLYETCLDRMEAFVADLERAVEGHAPKKFEDFRAVLKRIEGHPSARYFILKSIILNNLFGVDIMEEAVEICKLRLFLKLAAQVDPDQKHENLGIEPLPDIDFNIRAGNTLVGYATFDDVKKALTSKLDLENSLDRITRSAADLQQTFDVFRLRQVEGDGSVPAEDKQRLRVRLKALEHELNLQLANEYGLNPNGLSAHAKWVRSHKPFHWFIEYYGIMANGGFDIVIGNPPYIESSKIRDYKVRGYRTVASGNIYALCVERSSELVSQSGYIGVIVPLSGFSTARMGAYQNLLYRRFGGLAISFYSGDAHPSVLFDGVKYRLSIIIGSPAATGVSTTGYLRWYAAERGTLFDAKITYEACDFNVGFLRFAKLGEPIARQISKKLTAFPSLAVFVQKTGAGHITYHRSPVFWIRSMDFEPFFKSPVKDRSTDHLKDLYFSSRLLAKRVGASINSTFFYFWFCLQGNCRNIAASDIESMPVGNLQSIELNSVDDKFNRLMNDLRFKSRRRIYEYKTGTVEYDEFYPGRSKDIVDEIDATFAEHYNLSREETDFIINYDIKYRMGQSDTDEAAEEEED